MAKPSDEQLREAIKRGEKVGTGMRKAFKDFFMGTKEKKLKGRDLKKGSGVPKIRGKN